MMLRVRRRRASALAAALCFVFSACAGGDGNESGGSPDPTLELPSESLETTLAQSVKGVYLVDSIPTASGRITGSVQYDGTLPPDTLVRVTHDSEVCKAVPDAPISGTSAGIGDAVVWLYGVAHGPADDAPRRVQLLLDRCQLVPRVQRAPVGATLLVRSRDAIAARLRFLDALPEAGVVDDSIRVSRALVPLADAGAVVPVTSVLRTPGLVEVRDDHHPWVRGWIAVAPHPFVALSNSEGRFDLNDVPTGSYVLVAWHERLGTVSVPVVVDAGVETRVRLMLTGR